MKGDSQDRTLNERLAALAERLNAAIAAHGYVLVSQEPLWHLQVRPERGERGRLCLVSGIHGDEPAGIEALLRVLEAGVFPEGLAVDCFPCMNPQGYARGTRADASGLDLNRQFGLPAPAAPIDAFVAAVAGRRYDLFVDLHEDDRASGFYVMELVGERGCLSAGVAAAVEAAGLPLLPGDTLRALLEEEGVPCRGALPTGRVVHTLDEAPRVATAQSIYMREHHAAHVLTFESPTPAPFERRVAAQLAGLAFLFEQTRARGHLAQVPEAACP